MVERVGRATRVNPLQGNDADQSIGLGCLVLAVPVTLFLVIAFLSIVF